MTRGQKVKRFLMGGLLVVGGVLSLIPGTIISYIIGGLLAFSGIVFLTDKSSRMPGLLCTVLGGMFIASQLPIFGGIFSTILIITGIISLVTGGYLTYDTYKKINSY